MNQKPSANRVFEIFKELNAVPRPSHHEERVAHYLCQFAERLHLDYDRDAQNCVVIRKPASPGHENAETIVLLNHMDMVCVGMNDPLNDPIEAIVDGDWMHARGTSLGADNGIGLSMALAVLENDDIPHPALEVITTTNEEDGMSGAAQLSPHFIKGRKVINLDSEDYDTITTGAAGACLQFHRLPCTRVAAPAHNYLWYDIAIDGGLGGHSGVDINKGRASAVMLLLQLLRTVDGARVATIRAGQANASIPSSARATVCLPAGIDARALQRDTNEQLQTVFAATDPSIRCTITPCQPQAEVINPEAVEALLTATAQVPQGVVKMSENMPGTVETSNNMGRIATEDDHIFVSTHTRSFVDDDMHALSARIAQAFAAVGGTSQVVMAAPAWQENQHSPFLRLTSDTFNDVLGWRPRMVAMHFVLEAGFLVQHYPGIEIASIGPRIVEPHSTSERVQLSTIHDIWQVLLELLARLAQ